MIEFKKLKEEIVKRLSPFDPDKIVLFGSYAKGKATDESDVDLFLVKDGIADSEVREWRFRFEKELLDFQKKYRVGIDLFVDRSDRIKKRIEEYGDQFYIDVFQNGRVIYAK